MTLSALKILVVEDHGFQRRMALRLLAELGIETVQEAADGIAALELLQRLSEPPDVVLVDLDMPGMDGIEFIGHVAQLRLARGVALVSALDPALLNTVQTMARAYGLHVLGSVEKPLTVDKLQGVLASYKVRLQDEDDDEPAEASLEDMRAALLNGQLLPWFQPQVEFGNGKVVSVEALARWRRSDGHIVRPLQFVPLLEREGLAPRLTDLMLEQACQWKRRWDDQGLRLHVSVNVSASTLADPAAADHYQQIVQDHGVDPREVVLEVTESSLMADAARGLGVLARLRLKGFGLSIDDFGTGYSSLSQLSQIPFTELKIDQGFVSGAHTDPRKRAVIEASLELARKLQLEVVAEGVETVEDWQMLAELGCGMAQGYLIAKPAPGEELAAVVARWRRPEY
ncbi:EAL domain-containing response regulator [Luteimonas sp. 50]|uniref:EAL domain-containing response regulator n=1 Tax=Cognatiluteimonas sedimenti TaxID=2927791 RepID=A0ABT0A5K6_9GAMM|nr:EAL domain-containing response regulator [Lysobacter sedimenti]MCJ0826237.1 EAL domain-containing response regulator [Lysobacter sedimenti]